ncbi:MAG TPA: hypothetical protein VMV69_06925 [Pirellulales bacterium]|nr:hypothetical protein [Pirellulales bacterium]
METAAINRGGSACASGGTASSTVVGRGSTAGPTGVARFALAGAKVFDTAVEGGVAVAARGRFDVRASARRW